MEDTATLVKLDKGKPFATVCPPENGAHFHQDGFYFDHHGNLAKEMLDADAHERLRKLENRKKADAAANEARKKFMEQSGLTDTDLEGEDAVSTIMQAATMDSKGIDLVAWAKGEKSYPFYAIRKAVKDQYSYAGDTKDAIITWMVDNKKVTAADAGR
jgi:hypothetical protein